MVHPAILKQMGVLLALPVEVGAVMGTEVVEEMKVVNVHLVTTWNIRRYPMMLIQAHAVCLRFG